VEIKMMKNGTLKNAKNGKIQTVFWVNASYILHPH
jgi:hypothetical protein